MIKFKCLIVKIFLTIIIINTSLFAQQWGDYTLYATQNGTTAYLIDTNNVTFHSWSFSSSAKTGYSTYMLPGGTLVRSVAKQGNQLIGGGMTGQVQKVDWDGTVLWNFVHSSSTYCLHHDICPMPNGNVLMISYEVKTAAQAVQAGCSQSITIWAEKIIEVEPTGASTGTIVWEWHVWDHLCQNYNPAKDNYVTSIVDHPELININYNTQKDWMHVNGIDYNETLDQIVFSSHMLNELYVIDHSTTTAEAAGHTGGNSGKGGDILYRWGNPAAYQASGSTIFHVVHDAHWVPNDCPNAGYLVGFNNNGISNSQSSVDLIAPPYEGYNYSHTPGTAYTPSNYTLRHACNGHSNNESNSQQLPNGNMLVCIFQAGFIYEIDPNGTMIWSKSVSGQVGQAFRYTACYVSGYSLAVEAESSSDTICPGTVVQLNVNASGGSNYTYNWTSNPPGFTSTLQNPTVSPVQSTMYFVTVSSGGCSESAGVVIIVLPQPEKPTITEFENSLISSSGFTYQWYFEGNIIEGATEQIHTPLSNGIYQVQTGDENECVSPLSDPYEYYNTLIALHFDENVDIYPNPTDGIIFIYENLFIEQDFEVSVSDSKGKRIINIRNNKGQIDLSSQPDGIYYLFISSDKMGTIVRKIVLIH